MKTLHNEQGFVLVTGLLTLVVLTFLGIAATRNTTIELQIAGNDRLHQQNLYDAEALVNLGSEILEQNFYCEEGFTIDGTSPTYAVPPGDMPEPSNRDYAEVENLIRVYEQGAPLNDTVLSRNPSPREWDHSTDTALINTNITQRNLADVIYPAANIASEENVGYLYIGGQTQMLPGGALQMAAGYEGKGKGAGGGGVAKIMDIYSVYYGELNSQACVVMGWKHIIDTKDACKY